MGSARTCPQCGCVIESWEWRCVYCARAPRAAEHRQGCVVCGRADEHTHTRADQ